MHVSAHVAIFIPNPNDNVRAEGNEVILVGACPDCCRGRYLLLKRFTGMKPLENVNSCVSPPFSGRIDSTWEARHPDTIIWIQY